MAKVPERLPDGSKRAPALQELLQKMVDDFEINQAIIDASDHPGHCRCDKCREWWASLGPDEDGNYGPFSQEEMG